MLTRHQGGAFLFGEDDQFERELLFLCVRGAMDFERDHDAGNAVKVAAVGDGIDVRANQQRLERGIAAGARADDIPGKVNMDIQARGLHQADGILPALKIGLRVGYATHAALRVGPELRELFQMVMDALAVHAERRRRLGARRKERKQTDREKS